MPTYQYICQKCGHEFDLFQPISAKTLEICPKDVCPKKSWQKGKVKRAITGGAGLIFKGSGFYITDYRSEKYKEAAKKDSAAPASADPKPSATKEKPAGGKSEASAKKSSTKS